MADTTAEKKKSVGPLTFFAQVRQEARKVTWTTRKETVAATIMVLIMVVVAAIFFFAADQLVAFLVRLITQVGSL
ncbi:MAG: preprotein translocase subunit SecE [Alphaproteobacteria bacterium]|nr:preprotein translocase subunit SecE [Alphaproteobacteria bacterium]